MALADLIAAKGETPEGGIELVSEAPAKPEPKESAPAEPEESLGVEADEQGKPKSIPFARFAELNGKHKESTGRIKALEAEIATLKGQGPSEFEAAAQELYKGIEKPIEQLREDVTFAQIAWELRDDPTVRAALQKIAQHHQGATKAVTERAAPAPKPEAAPASDPRVDALVRERIRDTGRAILTEAKVREQLHGVILDYVLQQNPNPTREAVLTTVREYVASQGWTNEFIRGGGSKPKPAVVPSPSGLAGGTKVDQGKDAGEKKADRPKTLDGFQRESKSLFQSLVSQRMSQ